jgi:hypothetical protein
MSYNSGPSIVLAELWERQSAKGNQYFSGYWGGLQVALLKDGERPHPTRPEETITVWRLVAQERQPRDAAQKAAARPQERDEAPTPLHSPPRATARVLGPPSRRSAASAARVPAPGRSGSRPRSRAATGSRPIRTTRCHSEGGSTRERVALLPWQRAPARAITVVYEESSGRRQRWRAPCSAAPRGPEICGVPARLRQGPSAACRHPRPGCCPQGCLRYEDG